MQKQNSQRIAKSDGEKIVMAEYQGALPMPDMLEGYNKIDPTIIVLVGYVFAGFAAIKLDNTPLAITSVVSSTVTVAVAAVNGFLKDK